ncbi:MAG: hypothetical protein JF614_29985 [Acidobacteria bacterium]|nr:hypothetical protein [Acidobacteriota bacterium]
MKLEIANETSGIVHVALYKRSPLRPSEPAVAWAIVSPPPRGRAIFSIPRDYRVFARYSFSPEDPWQPVYQTNALSLRRNHDSLAIREISLGRSAWGAILTRNVRGAGLGELRIENTFSSGVWCHVQLGEHDVHPPRLLPPRGVLIEALASPFFIAVVSPLARVGAPLVEEEIRATEIELAAGEGGVYAIHGSPTRGYRITLGAPLHEERVTQPKKAAAPVRTKRTTPPRKPNKPPLAQPKKAPRTSGKKRAQATPKPDVQKQAAAKKTAKQATNRRHGGRKTKKKNTSSLPASSDGEPKSSV